MNRKVISAKAIEDAIGSMKQGMILSLNKNGDESFASMHEVIGALEEEMSELKEAVRVHENLEFIREELIDIAIAAVFTVACIDEKGIDE
jgi:hypothetical protein